MPLRPPIDPAILQSFAQSLRDLREAAGRPSIKHLASASYSRTTVGDVLNGRLQPSRRAVQAVATALGAEPEEWGRRWDALDLARRPPRRDGGQVGGCVNKPWGLWCSTHRRHKQLYGDATAGRFSPKTHSEVCSVEGCDRRYRPRGFCKSHYDRHLAAQRALAAQVAER